MIPRDISADRLIKELVSLRIAARRAIDGRKRAQTRRDNLCRIRDTEAPDSTLARAAIAQIAETDENLLQWRFLEIEIGNALSPMCAALDAKVSQCAIFDAICTNASDRDSEMVRKYGDKSSHIICVLDLENSATKADGIEIKPLKWCYTMAFMNAMQTNPKLDRFVHDEANEMFDGAFGGYREPSLTERLIGKSL